MPLRVKVSGTRFEAIRASRKSSLRKRRNNRGKLFGQLSASHSRAARFDPMQDPLRNDPRFQKLAASETAK